MKSSSLTLESNSSSSCPEVDENAPLSEGSHPEEAIMSGTRSKAASAKHNSTIIGPFTTDWITSPPDDDSDNDSDSVDNNNIANDEQIVTTQQQMELWHPPTSKTTMMMTTMMMMNPEIPGNSTDNNTNNNNDNNRYHHDMQSEEDDPIFLQWTQCTFGLHNLISHVVVALARMAAIYPKRVILTITAVAMILPPVAYVTNFRLEVEQEAILAPFNSLSRQHVDWIEKESDFPESTRPFDLLVHRNGDNVLNMETMDRVFDALRSFQETDGYTDICEESDYEDLSGNKACRITSATRFWWHNRTAFREQVNSDEELRRILSADEYPPTGTPVGDHDFILGNYYSVHVSPENEMHSQNTTDSSSHPSTETSIPSTMLVSAQSYIIRIDLPVVDTKTFAFEDLVTTRMLELRSNWQEDPDNSVRLEIFTFRSIPNEFMRAIVLDWPLYPAVFFIMVSFACLAFFRRDRVHSRCLLGFGSVCTIGLSLTTGVGLMSIIGVPLTNLTGSLAFVVFGVGLDDTFIIMGEFSRTDPRKDPVERICQTMEVVGLSIFVTTLTTMLAFGLGTLSDVPAVRWLCLYALPTILIDFLYQITYFVALVVLDERRIRANRRDCCFCISVTKRIALDYAEPNGQNDGGNENQRQQVSRFLESFDVDVPPKTYAQRFMTYYAKLLLLPRVKAVVILSFTIFLGLAVYSATKMEQEFKAEEIVPQDSYVKGFLHGVNEYSAQVIQVGVYFRDVDQSSNNAQMKMYNYVEDLVDEFSDMTEEPSFCWIRDFQQLENQNEASANILENFTFAQKLDVALSIPAIKEVYGSDIVRNSTGDITASRCWLFFKNLDMQSVQAQTDMLLKQRAISRSQPVYTDETRTRLPFFSFSIWYIIWEFYTVAISELILTTIAGIVAVSVVGFFFIPHWTGVLFITPLITTLYIDLLGALQFAGISVNVVTYVCLVISVGLLVDFIMHILIKYYESHGRTREEKVIDILENMGPSILMGGLSTLLGVVPLAFSTNEVNRIVFISFIAMVTFGLGHGLIFLPVVLSLVGPTNFKPRFHHHRRDNHKKLPKDVPENVEVLPQEENSVDISSNYGNCECLRKQTSGTDAEEAKEEEPAATDGNEDCMMTHPTPILLATAQGRIGLALRQDHQKTKQRGKLERQGKHTGMRIEETNC